MQLLNDPNIRIVLRDLINTELPITQRICASLESDIKINETIKNSYNIQANDILVNNPSILQALIKMEFVTKELMGQTLGCSNCKSVNIFAHYFCNNCKKGNFKRKEIMIHFNCGKIINHKKIRHDGQLLCPHCNIIFKNDPSEYRDANGYQCNTCNNIFLQPSVLYSCNSCNTEKFSINDGIWIDLFRYNLQSESLNKIKKNIFLLTDLEKFFNDLGYIVTQFEKFVTEDHSFGPFELIAYKDTEVFIFIILGNDLQHNISRIFEMDFAIKILDKETKSFAIALFETQEIILKLLKKFRAYPKIIFL